MGFFSEGIFEPVRSNRKTTMLFIDLRSFLHTHSETHTLRFHTKCCPVKSSAATQWNLREQKKTKKKHTHTQNKTYQIKDFYVKTQHVLAAFNLSEVVGARATTNSGSDDALVKACLASGIILFE